MVRDLETLSGQEFDLIVVGGGIQGACVAREAALNALRVALIERGDFSSATSHHSLKLIHGGIRYLQQFDLARVIRSIRERRFWLRAAPHLIRPLKVVVPTFGHGLRGRGAFIMATLIYNVLGLRANAGVAPSRRVGLARTIARRRLLGLLPEADESDVSGGAIWYDGQMTHADRVVLECIQQCTEHGGLCANYVSAEQVEAREGRVTGLRARCLLTKRPLTIRAPLIVNASGPWLMELPRQALNDHEVFPQSFNLNLALRCTPREYAFALRSRQLADSKIGEVKRFLFFTPWYGVTVAGTSHTPYYGDINHPQAEIEKVGRDFLAEINSTLKSRQFSTDDIVYTYWGLTPGDDANKGSGRALKSEILDHGPEGFSGLFSVAGVKFTTARYMAENVLRQLARLDGRGIMGKDDVPLPGGEDFVDDATLRRDLLAQFPSGERAVDHLMQYFGTMTLRVMQEPVGLDNAEAVQLGEGLARHVVYSARHEMVQTLSDFLVRRFNGVQGGRVSDRHVRCVAQLLGRELSWSRRQVDAEVAQFLSAFPS